MVEIREIKVFSKKLNKDIILEAYTGDKDGVTVITATSLKNEFEKIKDEYGITDSISSDVRINSAGNITYASIEWTLRDKNGYCSTFIGEATPLSLQTAIAKQYPKITAYNRAVSMGIKAYLQIPKNFYTNDEIALKDETVNAVQNEANNTSLSNNLTDNATAEPHNTVVTIKPADKNTSNSITAKLARTEETFKAKEINTDPVAAPLASNGSIQEAPEFIEDEKNEEDIIGDNTETLNNSAESENADTNIITDDAIVPIGIFAGKTVKELFEINTPVSRAFIQMCVLHQIKDSDENKMAIIDYIAKKAETNN